MRGRAGGHYIRPGWRAESGPAVRRVLLPRWAVSDLLDARCLIESLIARTAAERRSQDDHRALARAVTAGDADGAAAAARRHFTLAQETLRAVLTPHVCRTLVLPGPARPAKGRW